MGTRERRKLAEYDLWKFRELHDVILEDSGFPDLVKQVQEMEDRVNRIISGERRSSRKSRDNSGSRTSLARSGSHHANQKSDSKQSVRKGKK